MSEPTAKPTLVQWFRQRPWIAVALSTVIWVLSAFNRGRGNNLTLFWAATAAVLISLLLFGSLKAADYISGAETEPLRRQRARNIAIAVALGGLVALFYLATIARLGPNVFNRPI